MISGLSRILQKKTYQENMKIKTLALTAAAGMAAALFPRSAEACTNILVTKGAGADGSCMIWYAADFH